MIQERITPANFFRLMIRMFLWSCLELAAVYPLVVLLAVFGLHLSAAALLLFLLVIHYAAGLIGFSQTRDKAKTRMAAILGGALLAAACALAVYLIYGFSLKGALLLAAAVLLAGRGWIGGRKQFWGRLEYVLPLLGLAANLIVYAVSRNNELLTGYRPSFYIAVLVILITLLFRSNSDKLRAAFRANDKRPLPMGRILAANRKLTGWTLAVILLLTAWQGLGPLLSWLWGKAVSQISFPKQEIQPEMQETPDLALPGGGFQKGPSATPLWLKIAGYALLGIVLLAVLLFVCFLLYRLFSRWLPAGVKRFIHQLLLRLKQLGVAVKEQTGYVDEVERLEPLANRRKVKSRLKKQGSNAGSPESDPRAAYRSFIRSAMRKGFKFQASHTPGENGEKLAESGSYSNLTPQETKELIQVYELARYKDTNT